MRIFYQDIFRKQQILEGPSSIENFLNSQGDYRPLLELKKENSVTNRGIPWRDKLHWMNWPSHSLRIWRVPWPPGIDGFTVNFIHEFWPPLGHLVKDAVNESKFKGELTSTMIFAIFTLLLKGERDPTLAANFRPISLLSVIYKLVSCVIKNRLKK